MHFLGMEDDLQPVKQAEEFSKTASDLSTYAHVPAGSGTRTTIHILQRHALPRGQKSVLFVF